jgi:DNA-binding MarR family transcriptional regulator
MDERGGYGAPSGREQAVVALWGDLTQATDQVRARLARLLEAGPGLACEEVELLMRLAAAPERRLRMVDVSDSLRLSKSAVTRLVDRLEDRGFVLRAACPSDRRVVYAGLTEQGATALEGAAPIFVAGLMEHLGDRLEVAQVERLRRDLRDIVGCDQPVRPGAHRARDQTSPSAETPDRR